MRQTITPEMWQMMSEPQRKFVLLWKKRKRYSNDLLTLGQVIELFIAVSYNLHRDSSDGRFFNKTLINEESYLAWDGDELIDILWYELVKIMKKRAMFTQTFNEEDCAILITDEKKAG